MPETPYVDADHDLLPDDWEISVGLNPSNPADAMEDPDGDGMNNLLEFVSGNDPFKRDTDGDGVPDLTQFLRENPSREDLDDSWTVQVSGQNVTVNAFGNFSVRNISAPDQFGPSVVSFKSVTVTV